MKFNIRFVTVVRIRVIALLLLDLLLVLFGHLHLGRLLSLLGLPLFGHVEISKINPGMVKLPGYYWRPVKMYCYCFASAAKSTPLDRRRRLQQQLKDDENFAKFSRPQPAFFGRNCSFEEREKKLLSGP